MIAERLVLESIQQDKRRSVYATPEPTVVGESDPALDLLIVAACWRQCLDVGYTAVRRAVTVLEAIAETKGLRDGVQRELRVALTDFARGQITSTRLGQTVEWIAASADPARYVARGA